MGSKRLPKIVNQGLKRILNLLNWSNEYIENLKMEFFFTRTEHKTTGPDMDITEINGNARSVWMRKA